MFPPKSGLPQPRTHLYPKPMKSANPWVRDDHFISRRRERKNAYEWGSEAREFIRFEMALSEKDHTQRGFLKKNLQRRP